MAKNSLADEVSLSSDKYRERSVSKVIKNTTSNVEGGSKRIRNSSKMQVGIDSFAAAFDDASLAVSPSERLHDLVTQIERADQVGLDVFGVGEHHRREFLDSAPAVILAAAAARTQRIRLTSAVTVLSAADPVRVFQEFATLDLLSQGRAEMVVGRGSSIEAFPLFGLRLEDYDSLFAEKLDLLLKIRNNEHVYWSGEYRPTLTGQGVYPRPLQNPLPIWVGVGGTPQSFVRAGVLGLPLMVAIIGGETHRFRPLIDLYREAGRRAGHSPDQLKIGIHSLGYVAETTQQAADEFFPGYARAFTDIGKERGWRPVTRAGFDAQRSSQGALIIGDPDEVVKKIVRHSKALGGISRITFQMNAASLPHVKMMRAIELLGTRVAPALREELGGNDGRDD
jgi:probable LLM family oxidoreductase